MNQKAEVNRLELENEYLRRLLGLSWILVGILLVTVAIGGGAAFWIV
ncbi:hypothetical protein [Gracilibacillus xinjiangensis]|uniref:Uncharacterized protein n=1 Tax=Gracilibacillus xinjiangensis TaxID=1193282 RepID=A0ABV8WVY7_9BACI